MYINLYYVIYYMYGLCLLNERISNHNGQVHHSGVPMADMAGQCYWVHYFKPAILFIHGSED